MARKIVRHVDEGELLAHIGVQGRFVISRRIHDAEHEIDVVADTGVDIGYRRTAGTAEAAYDRAVFKRLQRLAFDRHLVGWEAYKRRDRRAACPPAIAAMAI